MGDGASHCFFAQGARCHSSLTQLAWSALTKIRELTFDPASIASSRFFLLDLN
jgi:hypothetical protein